MKTILRKKMLYKSKVEYMSGEGVYAMNHVLGCSHGCKYPCYAYLTAKRFGQVKDYEDWCEPKLVENTLELLERELAATHKEPIKRVHMCFTTDPFMVGRPEVRRMTYRAIRMLNAYGIPVTTLTKGEVPARACCFGDGPFREFVADSGEDAIYRYKRWPHEIDMHVDHPHPDNEYGISLSSLDENFRERCEPGAAPYAERIKSLRALHDAGFKTWASLEPWMEPVCYEDPTRQERNFLKIAENELRHVLASVGYVDRIVFGRANHDGHDKPGANPPLDAYYRRCANIVRSFCSEQGIECVIKAGTCVDEPR